MVHSSLSYIPSKSMSLRFAEPCEYCRPYMLVASLSSKVLSANWKTISVLSRECVVLKCTLNLITFVSLACRSFPPSMLSTSVMRLMRGMTLLFVIEYSMAWSLSVVFRMILVLCEPDGDAATFFLAVLLSMFVWEVDDNVISTCCMTSTLLPT